MQSNERLFDLECFTKTIKSLMLCFTWSGLRVVHCFTAVPSKMLPQQTEILICHKFSCTHAHRQSFLLQTRCTPTGNLNRTSLRPPRITPASPPPRSDPIPASLPHSGQHARERPTACFLRDSSSDAGFTADSESNRLQA